MYLFHKDFFCETGTPVWFDGADKNCNSNNGGFSNAMKKTAILAIPEFWKNCLFTCCIRNYFDMESLELSFLLK
jgi:hypothetical protein